MSQQQKQNDIHWLTGQFSDRQKEVSYRHSIESNVRSDARLALILASAIFAMFGITDYNLLGLTQEYYLLLASAFASITFLAAALMYAEVSAEGAIRIGLFLTTPPGAVAASTACLAQ